MPVRQPADSASEPEEGAADLERRIAERTAELQTSVDAALREAAERQAAAAALRRSEERFRLLAENATDFISKQALDGRFTYASPSSRAVLGYEPEELLGTSAIGLIHPADLQTIQAQMEAALRTDGVARVTCRVRRKDGTYAWVESTDRAVRDQATGKIIEIQSVSRDITDRVLAEDALRESESRFRNIFESSSVGIAIVGPDVRVRRVNRAAAAMLGFTEDELAGESFAGLMDASGMQVAHARQLLSQAQSAFSFEERFRKKGGDLFWAAVEVAPILGEGGVTQEHLAVLHDISERKRADDELRDLATLKSEFLALASHELRAPLTNINGGLELIWPDVQQLGAPTTRALEIVSNEARRLTRLVESILDISRLDAGQLPLVLGPVAIEPLVARAISGAEFAKRVVVASQPSLPLVWGDEVHLEQVLRNVIANAAKYAHGTISIESKLKRERVMICVIDGGPGIPLEDQREIFDPFFRGRQRSDRDGGYGLGLYFARRLVEAQGGAISVHSPVSDDPLHPGTMFCIALPLAPEVA